MPSFIDKATKAIGNAVDDIADDVVATAKKAAPKAPKKKKPAVAPKAGGGKVAGGAGFKGLKPELSGPLKAFIDASGGRISILSGYRSNERQAQLYAAGVAKYGKAGVRKWVAPPGKSNHNHGVAADLQFADDDARKWAHANAAKFGLTFPMDHEPWHIEPVGVRGSKQAYTTPPDTTESNAGVGGTGPGAPPAPNAPAPPATGEAMPETEDTPDFMGILMGMVGGAGVSAAVETGFTPGGVRMPDDLRKESVDAF